MTEKTFGIKLTEKVYDKTKSAIETNDLTAKERIEKAFDLYELNSVNDGTSGDYSNDLAELEFHTTFIYTLIINMITRSSYLKDHTIKEVMDKLANKEEYINELHDQHARRIILIS